MKFFNIGLPELVFLLVIMLVLLGPEGMQDYFKKAGRFVRKVTRSEFWRSSVSTYREVKRYPAQMMKELELEELEKELRRDLTEIEKTTHAEINAIQQEIDSAADSLKKPEHKPDQSPDQNSGKPNE